jgi:hypothetical protein
MRTQSIRVPCVSDPPAEEAAQAEQNRAAMPPEYCAAKDLARILEGKAIECSSGLFHSLEMPQLKETML